MPSPVGHTIGAFAAMLAVDPSIISTGRRLTLAMGTAFVVGTLADADFVVAYFSTTPYLRHHYFSHSIPFAIVFTLVCWVILKSIQFRNATRAMQAFWVQPMGAIFYWITLRRMEAGLMEYHYYGHFQIGTSLLRLTFS